MRSIFFITILSFSFLYLNAQQDSVLTDKKNRTILPEKNDLAFGISINPIFNYLGNSFNGSSHNFLNLGLLNNQLYAKYFLSNNAALRFRLGMKTTRKNVSVNSDYYLYDIEETFTEIDGTIGYEKRAGDTRLQLFYGGEINIAYETIKHEHNYVGFLPDDIELREADGLGVGLRGFFGVEYFLISKLSIGGECGLGVFSTDAFSSPDRKFNVNTDILGGQIFMLFHFNL